MAKKYKFFSNPKKSKICSMRPVQDDELDIYSTEHEINEFCSNIREHEGKNIAHHHTNLDVEIHQ